MVVVREIVVEVVMAAMLVTLAEIFVMVFVVVAAAVAVALVVVLVVHSVWKLLLQRYPNNFRSVTVLVAPRNEFPEITSWQLWPQAR